MNLQLVFKNIQNYKRCLTERCLYLCWSLNRAIGVIGYILARPGLRLSKALILSYRRVRLLPSSLHGKLPQIHSFVCHHYIGHIFPVI